ncbi:hypothetical protein HYE82_26000 [Streptomyces sp. BR123]|uniref:hypothetical protein n=1 Tax=Streptomyces sp. BR123 TaxID=2749828 RepID=UPI0015C41FA7|nr:hypothetical protein [Streptomyces sp. BR123]NXY97767.1 hypothetical protein [Streptomyces sp. BR123]
MRRIPLLALPVLCCAGLAACAPFDGSAEADVRYAEDFNSHEPLLVQGYPTDGSLRLVQQVVWRIADGDPDRLEDLSGSDASPQERAGTARRWTTEFREGAGGKATAVFCEPGEVHQAVVLRFPGTGQTKVLHVRLDGIGGEDGWRVRMNEAAGAPPEPLPPCAEL